MHKLLYTFVVYKVEYHDLLRKVDIRMPVVVLIENRLTVCRLDFIVDIIYTVFVDIYLVKTYSKVKMELASLFSFPILVV